MDMILVLEDGAVFRGVSFGAQGEACGWVHDDHRVVGYQEILTDPDNAGCLVNMTYPLIGNYGVNDEDSESGSLQVGALVVKEKSRVVSNWRATADLEKMMRDGGVIGMEKVDTRALSLYIRDHGEMKGVIGAAGTPVEILLRRLKTWKEPGIHSFRAERGSFFGKSAYRVVLYDLGVKRSTLDQLARSGCEVLAVSPSASWEDIQRLDPDGLVVSSGPGDPREAEGLVAEIGKAIGRLPILGIALGAQLLCLAAGGTVARMKVGHHGGNYAVRDLEGKTVAITAQNHSFVMESSPAFTNGMAVSHVNVNDGTVEGIASSECGALGVQFTPMPDEEGRPNAVFGRFTGYMVK